MGEYLYSARGVQSAAISDYFIRFLNLDPNDYNSTFLYEVFSEKWGNYFYQVRPAFGLRAFGGMYVKDRMLDSPHENLVSLPLYAKMAGISVSEVEFETAILNLKPEYNTDQFFVDELERATFSPI